ncbi:MAG: hypothetical protein H6755_05045 [Candidatus Omnitrophica bacterium]|nr:hypothetical protein [Candidatus Omnitrophota bacterium]
MTRDDIYDHLAQVYLGKRKKSDTRKKKQYNTWLVINIVITVMIFFSAFYGLTASLTRKGSTLQDNIIYALHNGSIRMEYNFRDSYTPTQSFVLAIPDINAQKYKKIEFSIRSKEEGSPGNVKVEFKNNKNEIAFYYIQDVGLEWRKYSIPLNEFKNITDWSQMNDISFILESWNVKQKKGVILIDDVHFSG